MSDRPILFSGPMVRAILDGRKTQTRRVVTRGKRFPDFLGGRGQESDLSAWGWSFDGPHQHGYMVLARGLNERYDNGCISIPCPYGDPGDRLWVRETWGFRGRQLSGDPARSLTFIEYQADGARRALVRHWDDESGLPKQREPRDRETPADYDAYLSAYWRAWRPSSHMPRWASRITLEVTEVRVQRLQEISEEDAAAEGVSEMDGLLDEMALCHRAVALGVPVEDSRTWFADLWDSINGEREGCSWDANPFVWAIAFKVLP